MCYSVGFRAKEKQDGGKEAVGFCSFPLLQSRLLNSAALMLLFQLWWLVIPSLLLPVTCPSPLLVESGHTLPPQQLHMHSFHKKRRERNGHDAT